MIALCKRHKCGRVPIYVARHLGSESEILLLKLTAATDLIAAHRSRPRDAVGGYIKRILMGPIGPAHAQWVDTWQLCALDATYVLRAEITPAHIACLLVHEAQHGRLARYGIPYNRAYRIRIERLCVSAEREFLTRLPECGTFLEELERSFDGISSYYSEPEVVERRLSALKELRAPAWLQRLARAVLKRSAA
jgi:hypothetical protein